MVEKPELNRNKSEQIAAQSETPPEESQVMRIGEYLANLLPSCVQCKRLLKTYGASAIFHMVLMVILGFILLETEEEIPGAAITSVVAPETEEAKELEPIDELKVEQVSRTDEISASSDAVACLKADAGFEIPALKPQLDFDVPGSGDLKEVGKKSSDLGKGMEEAVNASFFGAKSKGGRFVFVVDNSLSMGGGRFETACNELRKTVNALTPKQSFYVIFFSDAAYPMFYPYQAVSKLLPATDANKNKLARWLLSVELCLRTDCRAAIQLAFTLRPDVIYILGDGAFTDNTAALLTNPGQSRIPIHVLGMQVNGKDREEFRRIALRNSGRFADVGVDPKMRQLAEKQPRNRNRSRGVYWGRTLPLQAKPNLKKKRPKKRKK